MGCAFASSCLRLINTILPQVRSRAGTFQDKKATDGALARCDKCSSDMQLKTGRFGKYLGLVPNEEW